MSDILKGSGICRCGHDRGAHTRQVNDDGSCTMCNCKKFEDRDDA